MAPVGLFDSRFLNSVKFRVIVETAASELERDRPLVYLGRRPAIDEEDDDIIGRFKGTIFAADVIADEQKAVVYEAGQVEISTNAIPNIKHGQKLGQGQLSMLQRLRESGGRTMEGDAWMQWQLRTAENLVFGVRQTMNMLLCAMEMDLGNYNNLGIKLTGATWGMPANLKLTPAVAWSTDGTNVNTSATPLDDVFFQDQVMSDIYGGVFDRVTMGTLAFRWMVGTTQFANQATLPVAAHFLLPSAAISTRDIAQTMTIAGQVLRKIIQLDDAVFQKQTEAGATQHFHYLPRNKVILSRSTDDGNARIMHWGNAVVTESIVSSMMIGNPYGIAGRRRGPLGYYTAQSENMNPPGIIAWAVARGMPVKVMPESTSVLTVSPVEVNYPYSS